MAKSPTERQPRTGPEEGSETPPSPSEANAPRSSLLTLPNLLTSANLACGFAALTLVGSPDPSGRFLASLAVLVGLVFDLFDGWVARRTGTQTELGRQLDSLADLLTFGAAPALIVLRWPLSDAGLVGVLLAFGYVLAGALRLARFNVLTSLTKNQPGHFVGLPIPMAAGTLASLVLATRETALALPSLLGISGLFLFLSGLMVSRLDYPSLPRVLSSKRAFIGGLLAGLLISAVFVGARPVSFLTVVFWGYLALGPLLVLERRRRNHNEATKRDPLARAAR